MWRLALKNIAHYRGRTVTTAGLSFITTLFFVIYVAFMDGAHENMLHDTLKIYNAPIHIDDARYRDKGGFDYLLGDVERVRKTAAATGHVTAVSARLESYALLSGPRESAGAMLTGIEPDNERKLSLLEKALQSGRYLHKDDTNALYLGEELARRLQVGLGDEVAFIGSAVDGSFAAELFTVVGIFKTGLYEFDASAAFVNKAWFDDVMRSRNMASYLAVNVDDLSRVDAVTAALNAQLHSPREAVSWKTLMHALVQAMEVDSLFGYISLGLFLIVIFFVIMIYGFLNLSTRMREFGVLRALGVRSEQIRQLVVYEALLLCLPPIVLAAVMGYGIAGYYELHPIVIEGMAEAYKEYGIVSDTIPMRCDLFTISWNALTVFGLNLLSIVYPLYYVKGFTPVEAMRHV